MSGGSLNYLYSKDAAPYLYEVERVVAELRKLGHYAAADRTEEAAVKMRELAKLQAELSELWRAVEWYLSGDFGEQDVANEVAELASKAR